MEIAVRPICAGPSNAQSRLVNGLMPFLLEFSGSFSVSKGRLCTAKETDISILWVSCTQTNELFSKKKHFVFTRARFCSRCLLAVNGNLPHCCPTSCSTTVSTISWHDAVHSFSSVYCTWRVRISSSGTKFSVHPALVSLFQHSSIHVFFYQRSLTGNSFILNNFYVIVFGCSYMRCRKEYTEKSW